MLANCANLRLLLSLNKKSKILTPDIYTDMDYNSHIRYYQTKTEHTIGRLMIVHRPFDEKILRYDWKKQLELYI